MKKRKLIFLLVNISITFVSFSQDVKRTFIDSNNIYTVAFRAYLKYLDSLHLEPNENNFKNTINIEANLGITEQMPLRIANYYITYLSEDDIKKRTKNKSTIYLNQINPILIKDELLIIRIRNFHIKNISDKLYYGNSGSTIVTFKYNCNVNIYELFQVSMTDQ